MGLKLSEENSRECTEEVGSSTAMRWSRWTGFRKVQSRISFSNDGNSIVVGAIASFNVTAHPKLSST